MSDLLLILIALVGVLVGIVSVTVGSSSLISLPFLIAVGLNPVAAVATNKLAVFSSLLLGGTKYYKSKVLSERKLLVTLACTALFGSIIGANLVFKLNPLTLKIAVIVLSLLVLAITVIKKDLGQTDHLRIPSKLNYIQNLIAIFIISIYSGAIGLGAGTFMIFSFTYFLGYNFLKSSALMTIVNSASLIGATLYFFQQEAINYQYGIPLLIGTSIGGWMGSYLAIKKGAKLIKKLFIAVSLFLILKLIVDLI